MCIRVHYASYATACSRPFDHDRQIITLPSGLAAATVLSVVRAFLSELAVDQPADGAVCWCGDAVSVQARIPQQRKEQR